MKCSVSLSSFLEDGVQKVLHHSLDDRASCAANLSRLNVSCWPRSLRVFLPASHTHTHTHSFTHSHAQTHAHRLTHPHTLAHRPPHTHAHTCPRIRAHIHALFCTHTAQKFAQVAPPQCLKVLTNACTYLKEEGSRMYPTSSLIDYKRAGQAVKYQRPGAGRRCECDCSTGAQHADCYGTGPGLLHSGTPPDGSQAHEATGKAL